MDANNLMTSLLPLILSASGVVLAAVGAWLAKQVKKFLDNKDKRAIAETTVKYIEMVGKTLGGDEKFAKAKETLIQQLNNEGIPFTDLELEVLIEATVQGFKKEYAKVDEPKPIEVTTQDIVEDVIRPEVTE